MSSACLVTTITLKLFTPWSNYWRNHRNIEKITLPACMPHSSTSIPSPSIMSKDQQNPPKPVPRKPRVRTQSEPDSQLSDPDGELLRIIHVHVATIKLYSSISEVFDTVSIYRELECTHLILFTLYCLYHPSMLGLFIDLVWRADTGKTAPTKTKSTCTCMCMV